MFRNHKHRQDHWNWECNIITRHIRQTRSLNSSVHCRRMMRERGIRINEIKHMFYNETAEIIQGHAKQTYAVEGGKLNKDEIRVFYGKTNHGKTIHAVVALCEDAESLLLVTVYEPSLDVFEEDLKTLRSPKNDEE